MSVKAETVFETKKSLEDRVLGDKLFPVALKNTATDIEKLLTTTKGLSDKLSDLKKYLFATTFEVPLDLTGKIRRAACLTELSQSYFVDFFSDKIREYQPELIFAKEGEEPFDVVPAFGLETPIALSTFIINYIKTFPQKKEYIFITDNTELSVNSTNFDMFKKLRVKDIQKSTFISDLPFDGDEAIKEIFINISDLKDRAENKIIITVLEKFPLTLEDKIKFVVYHHREIPSNSRGEFNFIKIEELKPYFDRLGQLFLDLFPEAIDALTKRNELFEERVLINDLSPRRMDVFFDKPLAVVESASLTEIPPPLFGCFYSIYRASNSNPILDISSSNPLMIFSKYKSKDGKAYNASSKVNSTSIRPYSNVIGVKS